MIKIICYVKKKMFHALIIGLFTVISVSAAALQVPSMGMRTIGDAMLKARIGDTVWVDNGVYHENIIMAPGVSLIARSIFQATIDGDGKGTAVTMAKNSSISGFEIRNATIGIFSNHSGVTISSCRIMNNWQTGIITVRHLPKIEDNVIAYNRGSGIQGWDVRSTAASINHNTIAFNSNHGVAIGGSSEIIMENNVVAYNERFGLKINNNAKSIQIKNNNFYKNLLSFSPLPSGNFSFDPVFIAPRAKLNFKSDPTQCCKAKGTDNEELGARINY